MVQSTTERPLEGEAAPYYFLYINQVPAGEVGEILRTQLASTVALFSEISEERSHYHYAPGKWSVREVLSHLNDAERVFASRAFWFARGFDTPLPSFDQNVALQHARADSIQLAHHIDEFRAIRAATISLFASLDASAWRRSGIASDNPFSVRALAYIIAGHTEHHLLLLRQSYAAALSCGMLIGS